MSPFWFDDPGCPIDSEVNAAVVDAIQILKRAGAQVEIQPAALAVDIAESHRVFEPLVYGQLSGDRTGITPASGAAMMARMMQDPRGAATRAFRGTFQSHYAWMQADAARQEIRERWYEFFRQFDVVLMPVAPTAAPAHHNKLIDRFGRRFEVDGVARSYWDQVKWCAIANIAGAPATTIPVGLGKAGLPVGLQAMGPPGVI